MTSKIVIIYDCPLKECDKLWLRDELVKRGYIVKTVTFFCRISNIEQRGKTGKIAARLMTLWQCIKGMTVSKKGDTVICWSQWSGLFFNMLPGAKKRQIISYNWLTPIPNAKTRFLYVNALQNKNLTVIVNSPETKEKICQGYGVEGIENIVYIPDVFDNKEDFMTPVYQKKDRYCFSGGRANRDWELLKRIAEECPQISFKFVAVKSDWDNTNRMPSNAEVFFDLEPEKYYALLKNSYMSVYPLKEERVSGLINILKSVQMGKPVLTTDIAFTKKYFPEEYKDCLLPFADKEGWKREVEKVWNYREEEYICQVTGMQKHVKASFAPQMAGRKIDAIIASREEKEYCLR